MQGLESIVVGVTNKGVDMPARPSQKVWRQKQRLFRRVMENEDIATQMLHLPSVAEQFLRQRNLYSEDRLKDEVRNGARTFFHGILIKESYGLQLMESDQNNTIANAQIKSALTKEQVNTLAVMWDSEMERAGVRGMQLCDDWMFGKPMVRSYFLHGEESEYGDPEPRVVVQNVRFQNCDLGDAMGAMLEQMNA